MVIKPVNQQEIDVFIGDGWENHSRFKVFWNKKKPKLVLTKGKPLPSVEYNSLVSTLEQGQQ